MKSRKSLQEGFCSHQCMDGFCSFMQDDSEGICCTSGKRLLG
jgi:hypothetical protein